MNSLGGYVTKIVQNMYFFTQFKALGPVEYHKRDNNEAKMGQKHKIPNITSNNNIEVLKLH